MKTITLFLAILLSTGVGFAQKKVLVYTEWARFNHATGTAFYTMMKELGASNGFTVDSTGTSDGYFTDAKLAQYNAICFNNNCGDNILTAAEKTAFENYIKNGGGALFNHGASSGDYKWPFFHQCMGCTFQGHPYGIFTGTLNIIDTTNLSTGFFKSKKWVRSEEYDYWEPLTAGGTVANPPLVNPALNPDLHILITLDEATAPTPSNHNHPAVWYQYFQGGRSWYSLIGHNNSAYTDSLVKKHFLGGILFAIGSYNPDGKTKIGPDIRLITTNKQGNAISAQSTAAGLLKVNCTVPNTVVGKTLSFSVYSMRGTLMHSVLKERVLGNHTYTLPTHALGAGRYLISVKSTGFEQSATLTITK